MKHRPPEQFEGVDSHNVHETEKDEEGWTVRNIRTTLEPLEEREPVKIGCTARIIIRVVERLKKIYAHIICIHPEGRDKVHPMLWESRLMQRTS